MTTIIDTSAVVDQHVPPSATRKSISELFPLGAVMSRGCNNPVTVHSADDDAFARVWSLVAETMVAHGELSRNLKEKVADLVSKKNDCPICVTAHSMMVTASDEQGNADDAKLAAEYEKQVLDYAERAYSLARTRSQEPSQNEMEDSFSLLNDMAKAEIAMVVLTFTHMNRVVSAILGEEMSTAMFSVPRPVARTMENSNWIMNMMNTMMKPFLSGKLKKEREIGCTGKLFSNSTNEDSQQQTLDLDDMSVLPSNLQGAKSAGQGRALAVARLVEWTDGYEKKRIRSMNLLPQAVFDLLDDPESKPPAFYNYDKIIGWVDKTMNEKVASLVDVEEDQKKLTKVLLLACFAPQAVSKCPDWAYLVKKHGKQVARTLLIWWSLRVTLKEAKGFD